MKASECRNQSIDELRQQLLGLFEDQAKLRMQGRTGQVSRYHQFKQMRRDIARIKTVLLEKLNKGEGL